MPDPIALTLSQWIPASLRESLRPTALVLTRPVTGRRHGRHRSIRAGLGLDFRDHRVYTPGDDTRRLDWRAVARRDRLVLRQTEAEDEQPLVLVLDDGGAMAYGEGDQQKGAAARAFAAAIGWMAMRQGDPCGLALGRDGEIDVSVARPLGTGERERAIARRFAPAPGGYCPWSALLEQLAPRLPRRSLIFVISDFLDASEPTVSAQEGDARLQGALATLRAHENDIILLQILHRDELEFPWRDRKTMRFVDLRGLHVDVEGSVDAMRQAYLEQLGEHLRQLELACEHNGLMLHRYVTDEPLGVSFLELLQRLAGQAGAAAREVQG